MKKIFGLLVMVLVVSGCMAQEQQETHESKEEVRISADHEKVSIVASFYPLAYMAQEIGGDLVDVKNMAGSVSVHKYRPSPKDIIALNDADLVIYQGAQLEPWTEDLIPELTKKGVVTLEVAHGLTLHEMEEKHNDHEEDEEHEEEHEEKHEEHEEEHDDHDHGAFDPHTWLDPTRAQDMIDHITVQMVAVAPQHTEQFAANAAGLKDRFQDMDAIYTAVFAACDRDEVIVSHDAFGYVARHYGFTTHSIAGISPDDEPSAKLIGELKGEAQEGMTHILTEEHAVQRFAQTLSTETGLITLPVNPLGRGTLDPEKDFFDVMEVNMNSFKQALGCH